MIRSKVLLDVASLASCLDRIAARLGGIVKAYCEFARLGQSEVALLFDRNIISDRARVIERAGLNTPETYLSAAAFHLYAKDPRAPSGVADNEIEAVAVAIFPWLRIMDKSGRKSLHCPRLFPNLSHHLSHHFCGETMKFHDTAR
jgi:hypothetical protein